MKLNCHLSQSPPDKTLLKILYACNVSYYCQLLNSNSSSLIPYLLCRDSRGYSRIVRSSYVRSNRRRRLVCASVGLWSLDERHLLLLRLTLKVLVGTESERTTDQDDSVETNTGRSAVGCGSGGASLCVALGLWVTLLLSC